MLKSENVVVPSVGKRDDGKIFCITEMPVMQAEKWSWRMTFALKGSKQVDFPEELAKFGMVGVAIRGVQALLAADIKFADLEPLLDEMMLCVRAVRDPRHHPDVSLPLIDGDIEEISTVLWLRSEVLRLHTGFSFADGLSTLLDQLRREPSADSSLQSTSTSRP